MKLWIRIVHGERGANLVEYALLATLIAIAAVAAVRFFGTSNNELFEQVGSNL
jgi:Flp pilus assembly pilin Flp